MTRSAWACLVAPLFGMTLFLAGTVAAQEECPVFDRNQPDSAFCSSTCPCEVGEGGCRRDDECLTGICSPLAGPRFGLPADYGVCTTSFCTPAPDATACTPQCPCPEGWGTCDENADCQSGLFCGDGYGYLAGMTSTDNICVASCMPFDPTVPGASFCKDPACPCSEGQGNCTDSNQCTTGLHCEPKIGQAVGLPASYNVCSSTYWLTLKVTRQNGAQGDIDAPGVPNCVGTCLLTAATNTQVKLTADISFFSRVSWSGCTNVSGRDCYVTLNGSKQVTATIKPLFGF